MTTALTLDNLCPICGGKKFGDLTSTGDFYCKCVLYVDERKYSAQDMEDFAKWITEKAWPDERDGYWILSKTGEEITSADLREMWEQSRKEEQK